MNYHNITKDDMLNGDGLRVVLWVAGCSHCCYMCQNPITWNPNDGIQFDDNALNEIFVELSKDYISGITLSGGDPMYIDNRVCIEMLCKAIKSTFPTKTIWMYTGYTFEEIKDSNILNYIDVLVDGKFINDIKDVNLHWVGSSNQRVINVKETLKQNKIILWEE